MRGVSFRSAELATANIVIHIHTHTNKPKKKKKRKEKELFSGFLWAQRYLILPSGPPAGSRASPAAAATLRTNWVGGVWGPFQFTPPVETSPLFSPDD